MEVIGLSASKILKPVVIVTSSKRKEYKNDWIKTFYIDKHDFCVPCVAGNAQKNGTSVQWKVLEH